MIKSAIFCVIAMGFSTHAVELETKVIYEPKEKQVWIKVERADKTSVKKGSPEAIQLRNECLKKIDEIAGLLSGTDLLQTGVCTFRAEPPPLADGHHPYYHMAEGYLYAADEKSSAVLKEKYMPDCIELYSNRNLVSSIRNRAAEICRGDISFTDAGKQY